MITADPRIIEQLNTMNIQLRDVKAKVDEMAVYMRSIAMSLQILAKRGMVIKI